MFLGGFNWVFVPFDFEWKYYWYPDYWYKYGTYEMAKMALYALKQEFKTRNFICTVKCCYSYKWPEGSGQWFSKQFRFGYTIKRLRWCIWDDLFACVRLRSCRWQSRLCHIALVVGFGLYYSWKIYVLKFGFYLLGLSTGRVWGGMAF